MSSVQGDACELLCLDLAHNEKVRARMPPGAAATAAAGRAKSLGDPSRMRIALALAVGGQLCVCDLAWICGLPQNLTSHHVRRLKQAGLAKCRREGKLVIYSLTEPGDALVSQLLLSTDAVIA